ncbi:hypothetical protein [Brumimicrobium aurantiacum]|uniref:Uncharacterized protein n=1 Tax=Brumimicrobium aurantiacum TaxID=1737063 RepID=A0A3E1EXR8_9FLAO|nr:hypothetical protein [Brumimicrobium aurantiacum]RFC54355.1 hypothetical protein DXU93_07975 [Brumimicrobium aurantiacum]
MKRFLLISIVIAAIAWIGYSTYELWLNTDNTISPEYVFCDQDESILLINKFDETKSANYFNAIQKNPLANSLSNLDSIGQLELKIYASGNRPIVIFEKETKWKDEEVLLIKSHFKLTQLDFTKKGGHFMVSQNFEACQKNEETDDSRIDFLIDGDKKASANFWKKENDQWKRTDVYNLNKGFFEYRSSDPEAIYGEAVQDIPVFSSVIPYSSSTYSFKERFYAAENDSVFKNGPMNAWVDKGFVKLNYNGKPVIVSDYRSQQKPSLILIEQAQNEDSVFVMDDMHSFSGFQFTKDFPTVKNSRIYVIEIEDKVLLVESKNTARKILVDYQLGKTLALSPERQDQFFGGLPSHVNLRDISTDKKASLTWKNKLLFEVNTKPPNEQLNIKDKTTWSASADFEPYNLVPITDHLRKGTSVLSYNQSGKYELIGPNGNTIWKGDLKTPIKGKVKVIDVFDNNKHQFIFKTNKQVHLIDLNGNTVGGFPYQSQHVLTSGFSDFVWNGTKRFLIGNEKGEIIMLNSAGQELNIIQLGSEAIISTPFALNIKGNLRVWGLNASLEQLLGYLETPAKAKRLGKTSGQTAIKHNGKVVSYFEKDGKIYSQKTKSNGTLEKVKLIEEGKIFDVNEQHLIISKGNYFKVLDHHHDIIYSKQLPFNEVGSFEFVESQSTTIVLDYLQNKIHAYNKTGDELKDYPKEGRNLSFSAYNKYDQTLYTYTIISQSIICFKSKL